MDIPDTRSVDYIRRTERQRRAQITFSDGTIKSITRNESSNQFECPCKQLHTKDPDILRKHCRTHENVDSDLDTDMSLTVEVGHTPGNISYDLIYVNY